MKKLIAMLLALSLVLAFAGCAKTEPAPTTEASLPVDTSVDNTPETDGSDESVPAPSDTTPSEPEVTVMTHEEFLAAEVDAEVTVETYIQAIEGWWDGVVQLYCQGPDGAYYLYNVQCTEEFAADLVPGTKIRATGTKMVWNGEMEISDVTVEVLEGDSYVVAEAADLTALLGTDELDAHMNELGAFNGLTVVASTNANGDELPFLYKWDGSGEDGDDLYFNVTLGDQIFTFTVNVYMIGTGADSAVYNAVKSLEIGDTINITGFLYWYNNLQLHTTSLTVVE